MITQQLIDKITEAGIVNVMFMVPMRPVRTVLFISYTTSSDEPVIVPCKVTEDRYKFDEGYKITLESIYDGFGQQHFYTSDLVSLINQGSIEMFIKQN